MADTAAGRRGARRERGTAMIIAVLMVFMTVAFLFTYIAVPAAELNKVASGISRERAHEIAQAGLRDAIVWRMANSATALPFTKTWTTWGDPTNRGAGQYQWTMTDASSGGTTYLKVLSEGRAYAALMSSGSNTKYTEVDLEAYLAKQVTPGTMPAPVCWANPSNSPIDLAGVAMASPELYDSQNGGTPPSIVGTDAANSSNVVAGVAFQSSNMVFGDGNGQVTGNPPFQYSAPASAWQLVTDMVNTARDTPASPPGFQKYTYATGFGGVPQFTNQMIYVSIPTASVVTDSILTISGNHPCSGILIIDIQPGVTFSTTPIYQKNGTSWFRGALIFYQRGTVIGVDNSGTTADGIHLIHKNGNNPNFMQYDSVAIANAMQQLPSGYKFVSLRVMPGNAH